MAAADAVLKLATYTARSCVGVHRGVVISAGKMDKTVKVRVGGLKWNKQVQKSFKDPRSYLTHDPNNSLREGDVVEITGGWRTSRTKRHVVRSIIKPAGVPMSERPPIPTEQERLLEFHEHVRQKRERRGKPPLRSERELGMEAAPDALRAIGTRPETSLNDMD